MRLTKLERLILANQDRILARTDPRSADAYDTLRVAFEEGYGAGYCAAFDAMSDGLDSERCNFVTKTMSTYGAIQQSYSALSAEDRAGIGAWCVTSPGFGGKDETECLSYAQFVVEREQRFQYLGTPDGLNSHMPVLSTCRSMPARWQQSAETHRLTRGDLVTLPQS